MCFFMFFISIIPIEVAKDDEKKMELKEQQQQHRGGFCEFCRRRCDMHNDEKRWMMINTRYLILAAKDDVDSGRDFARC